MVLTEAGEPMTTKAMIEAMVLGQPRRSDATCFSSGDQVKGDEPRFVKVDRGQFALNDAGSPHAVAVNW